MAGFYEAVDAVIHGDVARLRAALAERPRLATDRAEAEHAATLLHYVAANGVEDELQKTPANAPDIARMLLAAGADADAVCEIYGGGPDTTPLVGLVTSEHPAKAGVQAALVEVLCREGGARVDGRNDDGTPLAMALSFFYPEAAAALIACGARVDNPVYAAAAGDLAKLRGYLEADAPLPDGAGPFEDLTLPADVCAAAFVYAAQGGHVHVMQWLCDTGLDIDVVSARNIHGTGVTAVHLAASAGHEAVLDWLTERGARLDVPDTQWGSTPAFWAELSGRDAIAKRLGG